MTPFAYRQGEAGELIEDPNQQEAVEHPRQPPSRRELRRRKCRRPTAFLDYRPEGGFEVLWARWCRYISKRRFDLVEAIAYSTHLSPAFLSRASRRAAISTCSVHHDKFCDCQLIPRPLSAEHF
jgi:hypothetical protein